VINYNYKMWIFMSVRSNSVSSYLSRHKLLVGYTDRTRKHV